MKQQKKFTYTTSLVDRYLPADFLSPCLKRFQISANKNFSAIFQSSKRHGVDSKLLYQTVSVSIPHHLQNKSLDGIDLTFFAPVFAST